MLHSVPAGDGGDAMQQRIEVPINKRMEILKKVNRFGIVSVLNLDSWMKRRIIYPTQMEKRLQCRSDPATQRR